MVNGAIYFDNDGVAQFQPAHVVVMAANGVGTPRLLLNLKSETFPNGLANGNDQVGRNLMFHPYASIWGYFHEETDGNRGPPLSLWSHEFYETDPSRGFLRGYSWQFGRGVGAILEAQQSMGNGRLPWGAEHHRVYRKLFNHRMTIAAICEDLPEPHNRVTLDPVLKDAHGIPAPKIDYTISENSNRMLDHAIARATECLREAGAWDVGVERPILNGGWHLLGTSRMGEDPPAASSTAGAARTR
jgi:choline dehydrogenase-like flavoprotein